MMTDNREGVAHSSPTSPLIVDLTGRLKKHTRTSHARRKVKSASASSTIYLFPAPRANSTRNEMPVRADEPAQRSRRLPRWIRSLTAWHGLVAGAIACYVLILCNLVYGLTSMAQLKAWRPLQGATISELQRRALTAPVECEQGQRLAASGVAAAPLASVLCSADKTFSDAIDELFPHGAVVREPRALRAR